MTSMGMRWVHPLNDKQWDFLTKQLNKKPTKKQRQMIKEAVENGRKLRVIR